MPGPLRWGLSLWAVSAVLAGCVPEDATPEPEPYVWALPAGFPTPKVPADNPMSEDKVELGRRLFYDPRLSGNETQSCASCHRQELAFTDGLAVAVGSTGEHHRRSSMSLTNAAYNVTLTWVNPVLTRLEDQALVPLFGESPVELGLAGMEDVLLQRLRDDPDYPELFRRAFPEEEDPVSLGAITRALASFQRTLISGNSAYDRYAYGGDTTALSASAMRGMELFYSETAECFHCHGGFNFSDAVRHDATAIEEITFHNNALYNLDGDGAYPAIDPGLVELSGKPGDMGRFRAPSLRNIAVTAPYMHDGSVATLEEVLAHYARGGREIAEGPNRGLGWMSPLKSEFVHGFSLTEQEKADLLAFLHSLTDEQFLSDPRLADPWKR